MLKYRKNHDLHDSWLRELNFDPTLSSAEIVIESFFLETATYMFRLSGILAMRFSSRFSGVPQTVEVYDVIENFDEEVLEWNRRIEEPHWNDGIRKGSVHKLTFASGHYGHQNRAYREKDEGIVFVCRSYQIVKISA